MIKSINSEFITEGECLSEINRLRLLLQRQILRPDVIPQELAISNHWVVWKYKVSKQENGMFRVNKQPYQPKNPYSEVSRSRSSDWSDLPTALGCLNENPHVDGIGYMFVEGDGLIGVDFDNCRNPITGAIQPEYQFWIEKFGSYAEISPSGTGIKIWVKGTVSDKYFESMESTGFRILNFAGGEIEIYRRGQYFTVTTQMANGFDSIKDAQTELDIICEFSLSSTQRNFSYSSCSEYQLTELDVNRELSLLDSFLDDLSLAYIDEPGPQLNMVAASVTDSLPFETNLLLKSKEECFGETRCKNCHEDSYGYELCRRCYADARPEEKVEDAVYEYFSKLSKFSVIRQPDYEITLGSKKMIPDVVLLDAERNLVAIAECKREGITYNGIEQLKSYLSASDTQFGIFANSIEPDNWVFYENLRRHRFDEGISRSRFELEILLPPIVPVESIREEKDRLLKETSELEKHHKRNLSNIESSNKNLEILRNQIADERQTFTKLKNDNQKLKDNYENLVKKIAELNIKIDRNAKQLEVQESLKLLSTHEKLTSEINILRLQRDELQNELENKQRQRWDLYNKIEFLTKQKNGYEREQNKIRVERAKLENDQKTWRMHKENRKAAKVELENEIVQLRKEITKKCRAIKDLRRLSWLDELEEAISDNTLYGQLETDFERLAELTSEIDYKQQLVRENQQKYATIEYMTLETNRKKQQLLQISQEREIVLKKLRTIVSRLTTANPGQEEKIEKDRKEFVDTLRRCKNEYIHLFTEIRRLQEDKSNLENEIAVQAHGILNLYELPSYIQEEKEIDILKGKKYELEAEIGHRVFELIPKKD